MRQFIYLNKFNLMVSIYAMENLNSYYYFINLNCFPSISFDHVSAFDY
jgi:hypothetical protein